MKESIFSFSSSKTFIEDKTYKAETTQGQAGAHCK